ncbi:MAG: single-stranded DNA-binding protein [Fischerella sp.]|nr:single-stranded DNA-binding protein [Fischerella sp.]
MNCCILMAEIVKEPELRFTPDGLEVTEMLVQFPAQREGDPAANLKVVGWGNMAKEIQQNYHIGDRVLLEGRLGMHTIDRPEGFKEKRAELTVQKIYSVSGGINTSPSPTVTGTANKVTASYNSPPSISTRPATNKVGVASQNDFSQSTSQSSNYEHSSYPAAVPNQELDIDDIPF